MMRTAKNLKNNMQNGVFVMETFMIIAGVVLIAVFGCIALFFPEQMWRFEHFMDVKDGKTTEWYIQSCRLKGFLLVLGDIIIAIIFVINLLR